MNLHSVSVFHYFISMKFEKSRLIFIIIHNIELQCKGAQKLVIQPIKEIWGTKNTDVEVCTTVIGFMIGIEIRCTRVYASTMWNCCLGNCRFRRDNDTQYAFTQSRRPISITTKFPEMSCTSSSRPRLGRGWLVCTERPSGSEIVCQLTLVYKMPDEPGWRRMCRM